MPRETQSSCETCVDKMLNSESHKSDGKEVSPESEERSCFFALFEGGSAGENPCASAHGQRHKSAGPLISIARVTNDSRDVQEHHEEKKHDSQHRCSRSCHYFDEDSHSCRHERHANKVRPKQPSRHERRHQSCHEAAINEMLHPKNDKGNGN